MEHLIVEADIMTNEHKYLKMPNPDSLRGRGLVETQCMFFFNYGRFNGGTKDTMENEQKYHQISPDAKILIPIVVRGVDET